MAATTFGTYYGAPPLCIPYPYQYTLESADAVEAAITLVEAKAWLREVLEDQDAVIDLQRAAATTNLEAEFGLVCVRRSFTFKANDWPWRRQQGCWGTTIQLPNGPFVDGCEVTSIKWKDQDGTQTTLDSSKYIVQAVNGQYGACSVTIKPGEIWPQIGYQYPDAVEIEYDLGWETEADVPQNVKAAVCFGTQELFERNNDRTDATMNTRLQNRSGMILSMYLAVNNYLRVA